MTDWRDAIVARTLWWTRPASPRLLGPDPFERPRAYRGWLWPVRMLLAIRYLWHKQALIHAYQAAGRYPLDPADFAARMHHRVRLGALPLSQLPAEMPSSPPIGRLPLAVHLLRSVVLAALVLVAVAGGTYVTHARAVSATQQQQLGRHLLHYAERTHLDRQVRVLRRLMEDLVEKTGTPAGEPPGGESLVEKTTRLGEGTCRSREESRDALLALFSGEREVQEQLSIALDRMGDDDARSTDIVTAFARVNEALLRRGLGYRLVPTVLGDLCTSYITDLELRAMVEGLLHAELGSCITTLVMPYAIEHQDVYESEGAEYPVYRLRRLAQTPMLETALGLTHLGGGGSELFLDRIRLYAIESLLPSLSRRGQTLIFPWARGNTAAEEEAAAAVKRSLDGLYDGRTAALRTFAADVVRTKDLAARAKLHQSFMSFGHGRPEEETSPVGLDVLSGFLLDETDSQSAVTTLQPPEEVDLLVMRLADAVARHEVHHQIVDARRMQGSWDVGRWRATLRPGADVDGVMDEVAAYLVQVYYAPQLRHVVLTQLTSFALSTVADGGREYHAGRIILAAMTHPQRGAAPSPRVLEGPLDVVNAFHKVAQATDADLADWARAAYRDVFGEPVPEIRLAR